MMSYSLIKVGRSITQLLPHHGKLVTVARTIGPKIYLSLWPSAVLSAGEWERGEEAVDRELFPVHLGLDGAPSHGVQDLVLGREKA